MRPIIFALLVGGCTAATHAAPAATAQTPRPPTTIDVPEGTASVVLTGPADVDAHGPGWMLSFHERSHACVNIPAGTERVSFTAVNRWTAAFSAEPCPDDESHEGDAALLGLLVGLML